MSEDNGNMVIFKGNMDDFKYIRGEMPKGSIGPKTEITLTYDKVSPTLTIQMRFVEDSDTVEVFYDGKWRVVPVIYDENRIPSIVFDPDQWE